MDDVEPFNFVAGHMALDFANTLDNRFDAARTVELLKSYGDLLRFCEQAAVLSGAQARRMLRRFSEKEKEEALREGRELREALEAIFASAAGGRRVSGADLAVLNEHLGEALEHRRIVAREGQFTWAWEGLDEQAAGGLRQIAFEAAELLVSGELGFVRECRNEACRWLFLDSSKNHSRVWCDMRLCGNRTKARRYWERHG